MPFRIGPKSEVLFGEHAADEVGEKTRSLGCSRVLCVFDQGVRDAGIVGPAMENLEKAGLKVVPYGGVLADPPDYMVNECGELARAEKVDGIVGVGGGSTLDTAKAVNVLLGNPGTIQNYYFAPALPDHKPGKPLVLVPTTAGTASEITSVAVITNTASNTKGGVKGAATSASCAIVDPLLTLGLPPAITAATGMDTFAHAVEAYTSGMANIMSDVLAERSIGLVARYLPRVVKNGSDLEARTKMCFACLIAGMAFSDAAPHFGHAFGHTLGSTHHVPHGTGCAIAQPGVIEIVVEAMPEKVRRIGELMGIEVKEGLPNPELGTAVSDGIIAFNREVGLPTLKQLNIEESDLPGLAEGMMKDVCFLFLPVKLDREDVLKVIRRAYAL